ncbi:MAG: SpoIID/LytB domain-containing protein [Candidatus Hydrothermae bacterium]|nr:SpoIID/LytB domain-containing protein [Candidatus Hydrothermae bacterium]
MNWKNNLFFILLALIFLSLQCARRKVVRVPEVEKFELPPVVQRPWGIRIRVGLGEFKKMQIQSVDSFWIYDKKGNLIWSGLGDKLSFNIKEARKASYLYYAFLGEYPTYSEALQAGSSWEDWGYRTRVTEKGKIFKIQGRIIDTRSYYLLEGPYFDIETLNKESPLERKGTYRELRIPPSGLIELKINDRKFQLKDFLRIDSKRPLIIKNFVSPNHYTGNVTKKNLILPPVIEIRTSNDGNLLLIDELDLELYVEGVLKGEMPLSFPLEALKAQAIAARTHALATCGKKLSLSSEPYDLTADIFSQAFMGYNTDTKIKKAVQETEGIILFYNSKPARIFFHSVCGGITASSEEIWGEKFPYLKNILDRGVKSVVVSLGTEDAVRKFINMKPDMNCNVSGIENHSLKYYSKYFRWQRSISASKLRESIKQEIGEDPGYILDVKVVRRGKSGRALTVLVKGTRRSIFIEGDFRIRKALGDRPLPSSLFYILHRGNQFIIRGAGFGHGVGMCQVGAASLAIQGKTYREILEHYFPGTYLEKIY